MFLKLCGQSSEQSGIYMEIDRNVDREEQKPYPKGVKARSAGDVKIAHRFAAVSYTH